MTRPAPTLSLIHICRLTIVEQLKFDSNGQTVDYNSFYASAFPAPENGVQFKLSKWDEEQKDYVPVETDTVENGTVAVTVTANGASYTFKDLEPGEYRVEQISNPTGTNEPSPRTIDIPVNSNGDHTVTFVNPIPTTGDVYKRQILRSSNRLQSVVTENRPNSN